MSWCPKCKQEFQDEITTCPTCDETLVATLDTTVVVKEIDFFSEEEVTKFISFLTYSNISNASWEKDEVLGLYRIRCNEDDMKEVLKLFDAFVSVEEETEEEREFDEKELSEEDSFSSQDTSAYVKKSDKYSDVNSTGIMLIGISIVGFVYILLNSSGIIHLLYGFISYGLNIALFSAAFIYGIFSLNQAKKMKGEIAEEETLINRIVSWLDETVTETFLEEHSDSSLPKEANYLKQAQIIKKLAQQQFPEAPVNMIENYIDEKLNEK